MKISGVYMIQSKSFPKECYIGSSNDIERRYKEHIYALRRGKHYSKLLQICYDIIGESDLMLIYLDRCDIDLKGREQVFIDDIMPSFNTCAFSNSMLGYKHTKECKKIMSNKKKGYKWDQKTFELNTTPVIQLDKDRKLIKKWQSIRSAARVTNIDLSSIWQCLTKKRKSAGGFIWIYELK
jgi:group I intron endonuclease